MSHHDRTRTFQIWHHSIAHCLYCCGQARATIAFVAAVLGAAFGSPCHLISQGAASG